MHPTAFTLVDLQFTPVIGSSELLLQISHTTVAGILPPVQHHASVAIGHIPFKIHQDLFEINVYPRIHKVLPRTLK
jgi:hypothetical protein